MKLIKRTFVTIAVFAFSATLALLATVLTLAACSEKVTLRFETFDGTPIGSVEGEAGKRYEQPSEPEKEGWYFDGWFLEEDLSGERQDLPEVMPKESRTYYARYAKYPVLTLDLDGGTSEKSELLIKPGVALCEYLRPYEPQKWGLKFGAWEKEGELLSEDFVMPDGDLTLKALYRASYSVEVYLQNADVPALFDLDEQLSVRGSDFEGSTFTPETPVLEHFYLNEEKTTLKSLVLRAGENKLSVYLMREEIDLRYFPSSEEEKTIHTRYGAHLTLESAPKAPSGTEFFGWAVKEGGPASGDYLPGSMITVTEPLALYGAWADVYESARGGATLSVARYGEQGEHNAIYREQGEQTAGSFSEADKSFRAGEHAGRLGEGRYFLPDDTGAYLGFDLMQNGADESRGTLSLDFSSGTAVYSCGGESVKGNYAYVYDGAAEKYTGKYEFMGSGRREGFSFLLGEGYFLREGEEKGEYLLYDPRSGDFDRSVRLFLDGFGKAVYTADGAETEGRYAGAEGAKDWKFSAETEFRFLAGGSVWHAESDFAGERGFMFYHGDAAGDYLSENGKLSLDGYYYRAVYESGEERFSGRYELSGGFVTLYAEEPLTFTLKGESFALSGAEHGEYRGEKGALLLDGAGSAELIGKEEISGSYASCGADEWQFSSDKENFRFRLRGEEYAVFRQELFRIYEGFYGIRLELDGYGGGVYVDYVKSRIPVTVGYYDGQNFEIRSSAFSDPLYFRLEGEELLLVQSRETGPYTIWENGKETESLLYLDGCGEARLYGEGEICGYTYSASSKEAKLRFGEETLCFLLRKEEGIALRKDAARSYYSEGGTLSLDGYGTATYRAGESVTGSYVLTEEGAELLSGDRLWKFRLEGEKLAKVSLFARYTGADGLLYLGEGGEAILRGAQEEIGHCVLGEVCSFRGEREFLFKLRGREYLLYDEEQAGEFSVTTGGKLLLDGCGGGIYTVGNTSVSGRGCREGNRIVLSSEGITTLSGQLAFALEEGVLRPLGNEFGEYTLWNGTKNASCILRLFGDGTAEYSFGGKTCPARYEESENENEFILALYGDSRRVRLEKREESACFLMLDETLSANAGTYRAEGVLKVDGYTVMLEGEKSETFEVLYATGNAIFVRDSQGNSLCLLIEGESFRILSAAMEFLSD